MFANIFMSKFYREIGRIDFPLIITCTLQGSSVTQGNPVTFTAKTFAVYDYAPAQDSSSFLPRKQPIIP